MVKGQVMVIMKNLKGKVMVIMKNLMKNLIPSLVWRLSELIISNEK